MSEKGCLRSFKIEEIESESIKIKGKVKLNDYKFPETDGSYGEVLKLGSNKLFNWGLNEGALKKDTSVYPRVPEKNSNNGNILYLESKRKARIKMGNNIWHDFGIINQTPEFVILPESVYTLPIVSNINDIPANIIDIQVKAVDPEGLNITYSYVLQKEINSIWTNTDISQIPQINTITENNLNDIHHFILTPNIYSNEYEGSFKLIIKASDGINIVQSTSLFTTGPTLAGRYTYSPPNIVGNNINHIVPDWFELDAFGNVIANSSDSMSSNPPIVTFSVDLLSMNVNGKGCSRSSTSSTSYLGHQNGYPWYYNVS